MKKRTGKEIKSKENDDLFDAILKLKTREECYWFFEDICTMKELDSIAQRLEVAKLLKEKNTFADIVEKTGASTATIARVNKCLKYGKGGYALVLDDNE